MSEHWDKEAIYDEHISPLMTRIIALCKEHEIPMVAQFQYADREDEGACLCTTAMTLFSHSCPEIKAVVRAAYPGEQGFVLAETIVTREDGTQDVTITRIR